MGANLIQALKQVPEFRNTRGQRHPLWLVLLLVIMGTMSGCFGYRALGKFVQRHHDILIKQLQIPKLRLPSYSTFRRVMMEIDFDALAAVFYDWAKDVPLNETEWLATEIKSIKAKLSNYDITYQNFVTIVTVFSLQQGLLAQLEELRNQPGNEIATVQLLIKALNIENVVCRPPYTVKLCTHNLSDYQKSL